MTTQNFEIIEAARNWIATPYRHQASQLGVGCDCLGLVRGVWRTIFAQEPSEIPPYAQFGKDATGAALLLTAAQQFLQPEQTERRPGRVVLFQVHKSIPPRHCGILLENNQFIHAQERLGVIVTALDTRWQRRIHSTYSFPSKG